MIGSRIAQYEILGEVGHGGMGVVYQARDTRLNREVALKFLPQHLASSAESRARFEQEARSASALDHDHICTIYEIGETADGQLFIAMPYYRGQTLGEAIEAGDLDRKRGLRLAAQAASALAAAHGKGIVHRDIKPGNLMLPENGTLKVLDFGLAKSVGDRDLTRPGSTVGTVAYMSPEQTRGEAPGPPSDVWSLGAVLYEVVSGRRPFEGDYDQAISYRILNEEPAPPTDDPQLNELILTCLQKNPADRPTARSLAAVLAALSGSGTVTTPVLQLAGNAGRSGRLAMTFSAIAVVVLVLSYGLVHLLGLPDWVMLLAGALLAVGLPITLVADRAERKGSGPSWMTRRNAVLGGYGAFALLALLTAGWFTSRAMGLGPAATLVSSGLLPEQSRVVLASIEDRTREEEFGSTVEGLLRVDLEGSAVVRLLSQEEIDESLALMEVTGASKLTRDLALTIARREGAEGVLVGDISPLGDGYVLSASLLQTHDAAPLVSVRQTAATSADLIEAVDRLSEQLRERIGESIRALRDEPPLERVTTRSLEALRYYSMELNGLASLNIMRRIELLRQAVAIDSTFAMASRRLATRLGFPNLREERYRAIRQAWRHREKLPPFERAVVAATYHDYMGDKKAMLDAAREAVLLRPDHGTANANYAYWLAEDGRYEESLPYARAAMDSPYFLTFRIMRATINLGRFSEARELVREMVRRVPERPQLYYLTMIAISALEPDSVRTVLEADTTLDESARRRMKGLVALMQGRRRDAIEEQDIGIPELARNNGYRMFLGRQWALAQADYALSILHDTTEALRQAERVLELRDDFFDGSNDEHTVSRLFARMGQSWRADSLFQAWEDSTYKQSVAERRDFPHYRRLYHAERAFEDGRWQEVVDSLDGITEHFKCAHCYTPIFGDALMRLGRVEEAEAAYQDLIRPEYSDYRASVAPMVVPVALDRLAGIAEDRGDWDATATYLTKALDLWKEADPELQSQVKDWQARRDQALDRLAAKASRN